VTAFGSLPTTTLNVATAAALQAVIDKATAASAPDMIAAVIAPEGTWAGASGVGGPDGRAATVEDEFAIASVTKTFTATLIMRLVEQGKIDLDAPLASYLGDLDVDANGATVRQTLGMRSGQAADGDDAAALIHADPGHAWTAAELVSHFPPPAAAAGETYIYSNYGYMLLAFAVEHVTGTTFANAMRTEVLDPVGATRVVPQGTDVPTPKPWALPIEAHFGGYKASDFGLGGAISCISSATFSIGGSSMASDAPSLAAWAWRLFAGDVIDPATLQLMLPTRTDRNGLGIEQMTDLGGLTAFGHGGSKSGYGSLLLVLPAEQVVVVIFVNDPDYASEPAARQLIAAASGG
jgi:D-alanyl-D-alanine carboxypeptidase